jgi:hypothetical protein
MTAPLTPETLATLDRLAAAATPGPWVAKHSGNPARSYVEAADGSLPVLLERQHDSDTLYKHRTRADAEYLAACDPATIRALVGRVQREADWEAVAHVLWTAIVNAAPELAEAIRRRAAWATKESAVNE